MSKTKSGARTAGEVPPGGASGGGDKPRPEAPTDPAELSRQIAEIAEKSQRLVAEFLSRQGGEGGLGMANPMAIATPSLK